MVRLESDGSFVLEMAGRELRAFLPGVVITSPQSTASRALIERLARVPVRCIVDDAKGGHRRFRAWYLAWRDKSGNVWLDLADELIREGLAGRSAPDSG